MELGKKHLLINKSALNDDILTWSAGYFLHIISYAKYRHVYFQVKSVCTFEGNTLKQIQKAPDGLEVSYIREFSPEEMKAVSTAAFRTPLLSCDLS